MAKRYNHQALTEAIKQGQARMKRTMMEEKTEPEAKPAEPIRQPEKERVHVGIGTIPSRRKKPVRINRSYFVFALVLVGLIAIVYWVGKDKDIQTAPPDTETTGQTEAARQEPAESLTNRAQQTRPQPQETVKPPAPPAVESRPQQEAPRPTAGPEKDHVIVIATYTKREHLLPAQEYFDKNGVKTEIMRRGSYYLLVTSQRFDSPLKNGTDGQRMLERIKTLGKQYKAPDGYENFGRIPFQDAYGMKVKN